SPPRAWVGLPGAGRRARRAFAGYSSDVLVAVEPVRPVGPQRAGGTASCHSRSATPRSPASARGWSRNTVEQIARKLQRRMHGRAWRAAGRLPGQRELAVELGVSRASLREAIAMLESLGLLRSEPGRGVFIVRPGDEAGALGARAPWRFGQRYALRDVYLVRNELEELAVAMAASAITPGGLARLRATIDRMSAAADARDMLLVSEADHAFHAIIVDIAGSPMLRDLAESIAEVAEHSRRLPLADPARVRDPIREHERIVDAMAT